MAKSRKKSQKKEEMSFLDHLEELRWHLVRSVLGATVFIVIAFLNRRFIFEEVILKPKNPEFFTNRMLINVNAWLETNFGLKTEALAINQNPLEIVNIDMAGQFMSHLKVSIVAGLIIASPYVIWEIWSFIKPALYPHEKRQATGAVFFISLLFLIGILFGYYIITPLSVHFLASYFVSSEVQNTIKLSSYIGTVTSVTFASGVIFELPMIILFLSKVGLVTPAFMRKYRRHAYIILLIIAAIITPPDVFSQILVSIPLIILYEVSVYLSWSVVRKKKKRLEAEEAGNNTNSPKIENE